MAAEKRDSNEDQPANSESCGEQRAWLEATDGKRLLIEGNLSIGRSPKNSCILDSPKISRRHAIVNVQNVGEFWLIDLGSSNGTFLNKHRVHQPVRLCDLDQIIIGVPCWLLVADIENFTPLSRSLTSDKLATLIGGWVATCKEIIEAHEGMIDKYLGDGFLAYWRDHKDATNNVADALAPLKLAQVRNEPRFRLALHFGLVAIGGVPTMGEESLMGRDVNFVFRMEKLAGSLGISLLTSAAGKSKLGSLMKYEPAGAHELKGFEGVHEFFRC